MLLSGSWYVHAVHAREENKWKRVRKKKTAWKKVKMHFRVIVKWTTFAFFSFPINLYFFFLCMHQKQSASPEQPQYYFPRLPTLFDVSLLLLAFVFMLCNNAILHFYSFYFFFSLVHINNLFSLLSDICINCSLKCCTISPFVVILPILWV